MSSMHMVGEDTDLGSAVAHPKPGEVTEPHVGAHSRAQFGCGTSEAR